MYEIRSALFGAERCILVPILCASHTSEGQQLTPSAKAARLRRDSGTISVGSIRTWQAVVK